MSLVASAEDNVQADYFLSHSLVPLANILMTEPSLLLVQCLLAVATLMQMYPPPQPVALFVSIALRIAQTLGLQQQQSDGTIEEKKTPQQTRVFWIAFYMDMSLCLLTQRLPGQRVVDIDVKVPEVKTKDKRGSISARVLVADLLPLRVQLSLIQAAAYDGLSSVVARKTSIESRISTLGRVLADLEAFRRHHPIFSHSPRDLRNSLFQSDLVHLVRLEAAYFLTKYLLYTQASTRWTTIKPLEGSLRLEFAERIDEMLVHKCFPDAARLATMISLVSRCGDALNW
ncbi:hypothetical protein N0V83_004130 [Neocucurbitaria cava]|uniref:Xylanolytic transcriptional activator regulatory domain-containing protein n=1 Tax=Neocucurbitaria cava TaxID=798079 RepID=A0A9W8YA75_9PLEO|nr:hypothetical protein N0V83_004130 [Neocucurbitaria cava]